MDPLTQSREVSSQDLMDPEKDDNHPNYEFFTQVELYHAEIAAEEFDPSVNFHDNGALDELLKKNPLNH